jgi:hypothetical protein
MNASTMHDVSDIVSGRQSSVRRTSRCRAGLTGVLLSALPSVCLAQSATVYLNEPSSRGAGPTVTNPAPGGADQQESPLWTAITGVPTSAATGTLFDEGALVSVLSSRPASQSTSNQSQIVQVGNANSAATTVIGSWNRTQQQQTGFQNNAVLNVGGYANVVATGQYGSGNAFNASVGANGSGAGSLNQLGIVQDGNNNTLAATIVGSGHNVSYAQYGDNLAGKVSVTGVGRGPISITQAPSFVPPSK